MPGTSPAGSPAHRNDWLCLTLHPSKQDGHNEGTAGSSQISQSSQHVTQQILQTHSVLPDHKPQALTDTVQTGNDIMYSIRSWAGSGEVNLNFLMLNHHMATTGKQERVIPERWRSFAKHLCWPGHCSQRWQNLWGPRFKATSCHCLISTQLPSDCHEPDTYILSDQLITCTALTVTN